MKKLKCILLSLAIFILPCFCVACSCGLEKYKSEDIKNLYKTIVEYQIDSKDGSNTMFATDYTICVDYAPAVKNVFISAEPTANEYNLYALENIYNPLFEAIFRYYEKWNENFFETADEVLSRNEFNNLYLKLNDIHDALRELNIAKENMEAIVTNRGVDGTPSYEITSYIYVLNNVVDKSIDFVSYFRDLHIAKIFNYDDVSTSTVTRTLDEMLLSFAKLVYIDNIIPFTTINGGTKICDVSILVKAYYDDNSYVKFYALDKLNTELRSDVVYALDNGTDAVILSQADQYMYYSNILKQNILTLESVSANINYYRLSLYRFGEVNGGVEEYSKTISAKEHTSYIFLAKLEDFLINEYLPILNELT